MAATAETLDQPRRVRPVPKRRWRRRLERTLVALIGLALLLATGLTYGVMARYAPAEGEPLLDPGFSTLEGGAPSRWQIVGGEGSVRVEDGALVVENDDPSRVVGVEQAIPLGANDPHVFLLKARVGLDGVSMGANPWNRARIYLVGRDAAGTLDWERPHKLLQDGGTSPPIPLAKVVEVAPAAKEALLSIRLARASGRLDLRDLSLQPLKEREAFQRMARWVGVGWGVVGLLLAIGFVRGASDRIAGLILALLLAAAAAVMLLPYDLRNPILAVFRGLMAGREGNEAVIGLLHAAALAAIGFLWRRARPKEPVWLFVAFMAVLAVGLEALQGLSVGFGADDLADVGFNLGGAVAGLALAQALKGPEREVKKRRRRRTAV
ncbi:MAG: hypothetical protein KDG89_08650 [Geminicoccaceae bacterium]|nr:hypothetical protein [Geminicoccaceae bacterium]